MFDAEIDFDCDDDLEIVPYKKKIAKKQIAVVDCETDPFAPAFLVRPFAIGFRTENLYLDFWGDNCVEQFFNWLATCDEQYIIYAHNGGKFDFFFFLKFMAQDTSPRIINGRLVQIFFGSQEFRDSFALIPEPLAAYAKDKIDYNKFTRHRREKYRVKILRYLQSDCDYLYTLVTGFHDFFGDKLTAASAALSMLNSFHAFEKITNDTIDEMFRQYYFGGRNQCFETGILKPDDKWLVVDRNSMYPAAMVECLHPISSTYELTNDITEKTDFACIVAHNNGALPFRHENGGLDFNIPFGTFYATIHEINAGLATGTLQIERVICAWEFEKKASFSDFVNYFYPKRLEAKRLGDNLRNILYKLILNSAYGKFALNPRKFKQWRMTINEMIEPLATEENPDGWTLHSSNGEFFIWERPNPRKGGFYNIATAASITGAAIANLLRNLQKARRPIYCDTDSIICENFDGNLHETQLGGWKIEATGNLAAIAGKKLYAIFDGKKTLKKASKGCKLTAEQILDICNGATVHYENPVPAFSFAKRNRNSVEMDAGGYATFINRNIKMTGKGIK